MIDTPNKRRSVQGYAAGVVYPQPGGVQDEAYRRHIAWLYAGIIVITPTAGLTLYNRPRSLTLYDRPGIGDTALTFVDGTVIEFVGGGEMQQAATPDGTLTLYNRSRSLTLQERP